MHSNDDLVRSDNASRVRALEGGDMKRQVRSLLNKLNASNVDAIVEKIVDLQLDDSESGRVDAFATCVVEYSYGSRRYFDDWGKLVALVIKRFAELDISSRVFSCFRLRMQSDLVATCEEGEDPQLKSQALRNQLLIGLQMVGDVFLAGACSVDDVGSFLRLIGFWDYGDTPIDVRPEGDDDSPDRRLPQCLFMSGCAPATQPKYGDNVQQWRQRLGAEMGIPGARIGLLQLDGTRLPLHTRFSDFDAGTSFQIMVLSPALQEEHRLEAVCVLLKKVALRLDLSEDGSDLKENLLQSLEALRPTVSKRFQFIIQDTIKASSGS
mmetsp:Transcript_66918/g.105903  ORF Transcript_66918/g.105903 Transcript_66918/m.105903 type:complete len:323 (-) Transcript_66918:249-1217(-)